MAIPSPLGTRQTVAALLTLTVVTGLVDAVSYLRLGHVFVANMTGNVVFLGFSVDPHSGLSAPSSLIAIAGFALGALAGGRTAHSLAGANPGRWLGIALIAESIVLGIVAVLTGTGVLPFTGHGGLVTIALLAAALGVQNSTVRHPRRSRPDHHRADTHPHRPGRGQRTGRWPRRQATPSSRLDRGHARRRGRGCGHPAVVRDRGHRDRRHPCHRRDRPCHRRWFCQTSGMTPGRSAATRPSAWRSRQVGSVGSVPVSRRASAALTYGREAAPSST